MHISDVQFIDFCAQIDMYLCNVYLNNLYMVSRQIVIQRYVSYKRFFVMHTIIMHFSNKNYLPKLNNGKIPISFHMHLAKEQKIRSLLFLLSISFSLKKVPISWKSMDDGEWINYAWKMPFVCQKRPRGLDTYSSP